MTNIKKSFEFHQHISDDAIVTLHKERINEIFIKTKIMVEAIKTIGLISKSNTEKKLLESKYSKLASEEYLQKTMEALKKKGIKSFVFNTVVDVKKKLYELIPENSEVMDMTSVTLKTLGIADEIRDSGRYRSYRKKLEQMDGKSHRKLDASADYSVGSVHAITLKGEILIASATGSQLAAYAYSSEKVVWIAGTQKIVKDLDDGMKRIYEYCLPLEDKRALKAYNSHSKVGKILTINSDNSDRLAVIFIRQTLGF